MTSWVWDARDLNSYFRTPTQVAALSNQLAKADSWFQLPKTKHEWTCASYLDIPDVKVARLEHECLQKVGLVDPYRWTDYHPTLQRSRKSFGVDPLQLWPLPEVLFVGHTNAGKLSLINNIFASKILGKKSSSNADLAFESRRAGYTKCLVSFNVNSKLRLIDTPGYGAYSVAEQGSLVMDYILQRTQLKKTYLVVDGAIGFRSEDELLMSHLQENERSFEIIFSRLDEVVKKKFSKNIIKEKAHKDQKAVSELATEGNTKVVEHFLKIMDSVDLKSYLHLSGVSFNNSRCNNILKIRSGYRELRGSIYNLHGL